MLLDHNVFGARSDHGDDFVPVDIGVYGAASLVAARALPPPAACIPILRTPLSVV
jgi:hypothetical protein